MTKKKIDTVKAVAFGIIGATEAIFMGKLTNMAVSKDDSSDFLMRIGGASSMLVILTSTRKWVDKTVDAIIERIDKEEGSNNE